MDSEIQKLVDEIQELIIKHNEIQKEEHKKLLSSDVNDIYVLRLQMHYIKEKMENMDIGRLKDMVLLHNMKHKTIKNIEKLTNKRYDGDRRDNWVTFERDIILDRIKNLLDPDKQNIKTQKSIDTFY